MSEPVIITTREPIQYGDFREEWSYERILDLFPEDNTLIHQLVKRCQQYEKEIEELKLSSKK